MIYLSADFHAFHLNIIKFCSRPWNDVSSMHEGLIRNWNNKVTSDDEVYFLGDFAMKCDIDKALSVRRRLNGKIHLILGNHDQTALKMQQIDPNCWESINDIKMLEISKRKSIFLCHYACRVWNGSHRNVPQAFGHSHNSLREDCNYLALDVGIDNPLWNYSPVSVDEFLVEIERLKKERNFKNE